ncbi:MAG: penicillin acylase family protein [Pyrinomonadaceae bacterium]|nr:penicillin acylase family protein [Pyrinomonadaceae bacterium]
MRRSLTLSSVLLLAISCLPLTFAQQTVTAESQTVQVQGLREGVVVRRDERGIPYITASNDEDLYFAQGYATAADRLWQMDLLRRTARGELAEIFGNNALEEDKRHRTFGFAQTADAEVTQAAPATRAILEAYARGVNAYIDGLEGRSLPPEFQILQYKPRPWTPSDSLVVVKLFFESLSNTWRLDVMREALADLPPEKRAALMPVTSPLDLLVVGKDIKKSTISTPVSAPPERTVSVETLRFLKSDEERMSQSLGRVGLAAENLAASNNWVVSGKHTASGKPLLANDPHLAPSAPPIWYLIHLKAPGVRVAGVTAPGFAGVVIGHNDRIAWGFTNVGPDVQDLYIEKFDLSNPRRYLTPTGWRDAEVRQEQIKVRKGFTDSATDTLTIDVTVTRHGPIVLEKDSKRYALRWTALDPKLNKATGVYELNRARNWREFTAAIRSYTPPMQNMVYADVDGHIGYYAAGMAPIRKSGDGSVPYDGSKDDGEWVSFIPFDKLPHVYNPPSGMVVTANQRIVGNDYPYFLTHSWAQPYRARRILDLLKQKKRMTAKDFRAILGDTYSIAAATFAREAAKSLRGHATSQSNEKLLETIAAFEGWDGRLNAEARVAPLVVQMRLAFRSKIINGALGPERARLFAWSNFDTTLDRIITTQPSDWLPSGFKTYGDLYLACYEEGRQTLTKSLGADETKWVWGEMVKARFPHPLAVAPLVGLQFTVPPVPQNGTGGLAGATVNVGAAVSMRLIADPSDWDVSQHGISLGQSGIPTSPHWTDQLADWRAVTPRAFPFSDAAIEKATKRTILLQPK